MTRAELIKYKINLLDEQIKVLEDEREKLLLELDEENGKM